MGAGHWWTIFGCRLQMANPSIISARACLSQRFLGISCFMWLPIPLCYIDDGMMPVQGPCLFRASKALPPGGWRLYSAWRQMVRRAEGVVHRAKGRIGGVGWPGCCLVSPSIPTTFPRFGKTWPKLWGSARPNDVMSSSFY